MTTSAEMTPFREAETAVLVAEDRLATASAFGTARERAEARMLLRQAVERRDFLVRWEGEPGD